MDWTRAWPAEQTREGQSEVCNMGGEGMGTGVGISSALSRKERT